MKTNDIEIRDIRKMKGLARIEWSELSIMLGEKDDEIELKCPILF